MRRVARGDRTPLEPGLYFESVDELRRMLTEKRLELLLATPAIGRRRFTSWPDCWGAITRT